jgi:Uma2 family endonuclease
MATAIEPRTTIEPARYRFTAEEYHRMGEVGILTEDDRVELIEGDITQMSPVGGPHANCVDALTRIFAPLAGTDARLRVQNAVRLSDDTEVYPDISIVRERVYGDDLPGAADVLLLIEVADSTFLSDRDFKVPLYSRYGIPQTLLVDVKSRCVWHFGEPDEDGYRLTRRYLSGQRFDIVLTPTLSFGIAVDDLFAS